MATPGKLSIDLPRRFDGFRIEIASDEQHYAVIDHIAQHFFRDEPMNKSLGTADDPEAIEEMCDKMKSFLPHCVCLITVEEKTGNIVGLATLLFPRSCDQGNRLLTDGLVPVSEVKNEKRKMITHLRTDVLNMVQEDLFVKYETDLIVDLGILSVSSEFRQKGIGKRLVDAVLDVARKRGAGALKGEFTSNFSQSLVKKIGLEVLAELRFDEYKIDGKVVFTNTAPHEYFKYMAGRIQ